MSAPGEKLRAAVKARVSELAWHQWLEGLKLEKWHATPGILVVSVPEKGAAWVRERYGKVIADEAARLVNRPVRLTIDERDEPAEVGIVGTPPTGPPPVPPRQPPPTPPPGSQPPQAPPERERYRRRRSDVAA